MCFFPHSRPSDLCPPFKEKGNKTTFAFYRNVNAFFFIHPTIGRTAASCSLYQIRSFHAQYLQRCSLCVVSCSFFNAWFFLCQSNRPRLRAATVRKARFPQFYSCTTSHMHPDFTGVIISVANCVRDAS